MAPQSAMSVQNSNTYDINANVTIGIDETVPLGGIVIPPLSIYSTEGNGGSDRQKEEIKVGTNPNDPYGVGLTERELSYVTADNKLLLFEVSAGTVYLFDCIVYQSCFLSADGNQSPEVHYCQIISIQFS